VSYEIRIKRTAQKDLANLHSGLKLAVKAAIDNLAADPRPHGSRPLYGRLKGLWRIRVGDYRVVYRIDDPAHTVTIAAIGPRGGVYT
jgi:mRNA interferase RelE/StbE